MEKEKFVLQLFADSDSVEGNGVDNAENTATATGVTDNGDANKKQADEKAVPKYTDDDVDRILNRKFAAWQKTQEKTKNEAERLGRMTAEEQANERMKALEDKLREYELSAARAEMTKQARAILQNKGIHASDALIANLVNAEDADATKEAAESFVALFQEAVQREVKALVKSEAPKAGGGSVVLTKEQILAIPNRAERQAKLAEYAARNNM